MKKIIKNTTTRNKTKKEKLSKEHIYPKHLISDKKTILFLTGLLEINEDKESILFNIGKSLVTNHKNTFFNEFISEYEYPEIKIENIPNNEFDLLGIVYQFLNTKYENLSKGSFYTKKEMAREMCDSFVFDNGQELIDLSCGSGVFLFSSDAPPEQLIGIDYDPIAVMIAKFNFFIKFPDTSIYPRIYNEDFIKWYSKNKNKRFDYIVGNPPYGAELDLTNEESNIIKTGESFSYFIEYGSKLLKENGVISYLLPESFLNVKRHNDIRDYILDELNLVKIKRYDGKFSGVMSDIYQVVINKKSDEKVEFILDNNNITYIKKKSFKKLKNHIFAYFNNQDFSIISKVKIKEKTNLKNSVFGLGVVTGNNKEKLLDSPTSNSEVIYTGKEVKKYTLGKPKKFIVFERNNLQQVAPDDIYRADEKIVYKVISDKIKVAIDFSKSLTSNSANILIPKVEKNNIYSISLLLNSKLYNFINKKLYGGVNKIAKENLQDLPIPFFNENELKKIKLLVENFINNNIEEEKLDDFVYDIFNISNDEREYIESIIKWNSLNTPRRTI